MIFANTWNLVIAQARSVSKGLGLMAVLDRMQALSVDT